MAYDGGEWSLDVFDLASGTATRIASSVSATWVRWSPDGRALAVDDTMSAASMGVVSLYWIDDAGSDTSLPGTLDVSSGQFLDLIWSTHYRIEFVLNANDADSYLYSYDLAGTFEFVDTRLEYEENDFLALAVDSSGNWSDASDPITVIFDAPLADLDVTEGAIYVYPKYPGVEEPAVLYIEVHNAGDETASNATLDVYVESPSGALNLVGSEILADIPPGGSEFSSFSWQSTDGGGGYTIYVVVDGDDTVYEKSDDNNLAVKEITVIAGNDIALEAEVVDNVVSANEDVVIDIRVINPAYGKDVEVSTYIETESGEIVAELDTLSGNVSYETELVSTLSWNVGVIYAGTYRARAVLISSDGVTIESSRGFTIEPDISLEVTISSDKAEYGSNDSINIETLLENHGLNYVIPEVVVDVVVSGPGGVVVYSDSETVVNMLPLSNSALAAVLKLSGAEAGAYIASVSVSSDGEVVASTEAAIEVREEVIVTGKIGLETRSLYLDESLEYDFTIVNSGNINLTGLPLYLTIVRAENGASVFREGVEMDITLGQSHVDSGALPVNDLEPAVYSMILSYEWNGIEYTIASENFTVKERLSVVGDVTLASNAIESGRLIKISYSLDNLSLYTMGDIALVFSIRIQNAAKELYTHEIPVSVAPGDTLTAEVTLSADVLSFGDYVLELSYRYEDDEIALDSEAFSVVDLAAPSVNIVAPSDGALIMGVTELSLIATDEASGVDAVEYRIDSGNWISMIAVVGDTYVATWSTGTADDGAHTISFRATDIAGNTSEAVSVSVIVDMTPPQVTTLKPESGGIYNGPVALNASAKDDASGVASAEYRIDGGLWMAMSLGSGAEYTATWTPSSADEGNRTIHFRATDKAGNVSDSVSVSITIDLTPPAPPVITSPEEGYISIVDTVTIEGLSEAGAWIEMTRSGVATSFINDGDDGFQFADLILDIGENVFTFVAEDLAGNRSEPTVLTVVYAPIEMTITLPSDERNALVWINTGCDPETLKNCDNLETVLSVVDELMPGATVVYDKKDFQSELGNPYYTDIVILGDQSPIEDHYSDILREKVSAGMGFVSSTFTREGLDETVFGIKQTGKLPGGGFTLEVAESGMSSAGTYQISGDALSVESEGAEVLGWMVEETNKGIEYHPAVLTNSYGNGRTVVFAVELEAQGAEVMKALLGAAVEYAHRTQEVGKEYAPYSLVPLRVALSTEGEAIDVRYELAYPEGISIYNASSGEWLSESPYVLEAAVEKDSPVEAVLYLLTPETEGTYVLESAVGYLKGEEFVEVASEEQELIVVSREALVDTAISEMRALAASPEEAEWVAEAVSAVEGIALRGYSTEGAVESDIKDLLHAIDMIRKVTSADASGAIWAMDALLESLVGGLYMIY